jgi:antitoxin component YwqK of YwqJK toxin-antitoxin module
MKPVLFYPVLILTAAVLWTACSNLELVQEFDESGNLHAEYQKDKQSGKKEGSYKMYYPDGKLQEEATYQNDSLEGKRVLYYPSGAAHIEELYANGNIQGAYQVFFETGQVEVEGTYADNSMTGIWKRFYPNGQLMEEVTFEENQENGPFVEYYENGKLKAEGSYLNGDFEHGLLKLYNETGELMRKMQCESGVCRTIWTLEEGDVTPVNMEI